LLDFLFALTGLLFSLFHSLSPRYLLIFEHNFANGRLFLALLPL
jgi:hypothetical protein